MVTIASVMLTAPTFWPVLFRFFSPLHRKSSTAVHTGIEKTISSYIFMKQNILHK